jgi:WD40 repeat protein
MNHLRWRLLLLIAGATAGLLATNRPVRCEGDHASLPQGAVFQIGKVQRASDGRISSILYKHRLRSLTYTHNGTRIVSVAGTVLRLHDATSGKLIREMDDAVLGDAIAVSPDDKRIASGDGGFAVWETDTGKVLLRIPKLGVIIDGLAFTGDKGLKCAYTRSSDLGGLEPWIATWDIHTQKPTRRLHLEFPKDALHVIRSLSPDGRFLASAVTSGFGSLPGYGPPVYLWDSESGKRLRQVGAAELDPQVASFSIDGGMLATSGFYSPIQVWDTATGKEHCRIPWEGRNRASCIAFSSNGRFLATAEVNSRRPRTIRVFALRDGKEVRTFVGHDRDVHCLSFSPDGRRLASGSDDSTVVVWDLGDACKELPGERASAIAVDEVRRREGWSGEANSPVRQSDGWSVIVWRLPKTPGGFRTVAVGDDGKIGRYEHGK